MEDECCQVDRHDSSILEPVDGKITMYCNGYTQLIELNAAKKFVEEGIAVVIDKHSLKRILERKEFNYMILKRDNFTCAYCEKKGKTVDHVVPKSKGGLRLFSNCVCACKKCNVHKGDKLIPLGQIPDPPVKKKKKKKSRKKRRSKKKGMINHGNDTSAVSGRGQAKGNIGKAFA